MKNFINKIGMKTIKMVGIFLLLFIVVLIGGALIYNKFFYKKSFKEIENIMLDASQVYINNHTDLLSDKINGVVNIPVQDLVNDETMKDISEYLKDESISCSGSVNVTNLGKNYRYTPILDCGEDYHTKLFVDYLKDIVKVVTSGNGLYEMNNELIYRGDTVNNYITFGKNSENTMGSYRIVKISDGYVVIISDDEKPELNVWDNRYNIEKKSSVGINDFNVSRIKSFLDNLYNSSKFSNFEKNLIVPHKVGIGKRNNNDIDNSGKLENAVYIENQYLSLLPLYNFLNASLDDNCFESASYSCQNYNYLNSYPKNWWTITANSDDTSKVFMISSDGSASLSNASNSKAVRYVLYVAKDAIYVDGNGSKNNPYIIK